MHLEEITHTWATTDGSFNVVKAMCLSKGINIEQLTINFGAQIIRSI